VAPPRLLSLLASGEFDWDDLRHRQVFLRNWVEGDPDLNPAAGSAEGEDEGEVGRAPADNQGPQEIHG
jgi:hypothetical protein